VTAHDPTDVAMHATAGKDLLNPLVRHAAAKVHLAGLGIDAETVPALFGWLESRGLLFHAKGPGKFWVKISQPVYDEEGKLTDYEEIAHADGLTFGAALVVAVYAAAVAVPGLAGGEDINPR
jgi:hypothetical protein